jgi:hypothetical protein
MSRKIMPPVYAGGIASQEVDYGARMRGSALAGLEAALRLVDHVNATLPADEPVVAVTLAQRAERVADFHC